jgi:hypothetical protein
LERPFFCRYNANFFKKTNKVLTFVAFLGIYFFVFLFRNMSSGSSQRRVRQRTNEGIAATRARVETRPMIIERNVLRANVMVPPFDFIDQLI